MIFFKEKRLNTPVISRFFISPYSYFPASNHSQCVILSDLFVILNACRDLSGERSGAKNLLPYLTGIKKYG